MKEVPWEAEMVLQVSLLILFSLCSDKRSILMAASTMCELCSLQSGHNEENHGERNWKHPK